MNSSYAPFIVIADIKTLQVPESTAMHNTSKSGSTTIKHYQSYLAGYHIISTDPKYNFEPKIFRGQYCIQYFLDSLQYDYLKLKDMSIIHRKCR